MANSIDDALFEYITPNIDTIEADEEFNEMIDELSGFNVDPIRPINECPKCKGRMLADHLGQYICDTKNCGVVIPIHGDLEVDGNHSEKVNILYTSTGEHVGGRVDGLSVDPAHSAFRAVHKEYMKANNKRANKLDAKALREAAARFVEARSHAPVRGDNQRAMKELFLREALKNHSDSREPQETAQFLGIKKTKRAFARATINSLVSKGKIAPMTSIHNDTEDFTKNYLNKLDIDMKYAGFINDIATRASTALVQAPAAKSKCIGAIWILILAKGINCTADKLAKDLNIKQNTFVSVAVSVMTNLPKFQSIFDKHEINSKIDLAKVQAKRGAR